MDATPIQNALSAIDADVRTTDASVRTTDASVRTTDASVGIANATANATVGATAEYDADAARALAASQGLYRPDFEHDACGVGFVAHIKGKKSHTIIEQGLQILCNLDHRGAVGADPADGRRRRHPDPDPGPVLPRGDGAARA